MFRWPKKFPAGLADSETWWASTAEQSPWKVEA
jgi:hypothetical protein